MPCVPYAGPGVGIAFLPEVNSGVWIEFEGGDVSFPIWVGGYWRDGEVRPDVGAAVKVIVTKAPASPVCIRLRHDGGEQGPGDRRRFDTQLAAQDLPAGLVLADRLALAGAAFADEKKDDGGKRIG